MNLRRLYRLAGAHMYSALTNHRCAAPGLRRFARLLANLPSADAPRPDGTEGSFLRRLTPYERELVQAAREWLRRKGLQW